MSWKWRHGICFVCFVCLDNLYEACEILRGTSLTAQSGQKFKMCPTAKPPDFAAFAQE